MSVQKIVQICALSVLLVAGGAAAQTAGSVNVSTTPVTSSVSAGSGVNLGTITLTGVQGGGSVTSIPLTVVGSNGGAAGNLSNCQVYNNQGTSLTSNNVVNNLTTANTFTFNSPLAVNATTGTTTLTLRCDVSSSTPVGSIFTLSAGAASIGPVLRVNLDTAPSVPAGSQDVTIANIAIGATGTNFNVASVPLVITASSNGSVANLTDCKIRDTSNLNGSLSNAVAVSNGATTFNLLAPLFVSAGGARMLALTCDVQPAAAVGSTFTTSVTPSNVIATNAVTGASVTPVAVESGGVGPNGLPASTSGTTIVSAAGSAPVNPGTGTGTTPGIPNTGFGSNLTLLAELVLAGLIALAGAFYLGRKQA